MFTGDKPQRPDLPTVHCVLQRLMRFAPLKVQQAGKADLQVIKEIVDVLNAVPLCAAVSGHEIF